MNKLREKREELSLRQVDVAKLTGVGLTTIWLLENGYDRRVSQKTKKKIAQGLKLKVQEVFPQI